MKNMYYSTAELSNLWNVSYITVGNWIRQGKLPAVMEDGEWKVLKSDALSFAHNYGSFSKPRRSLLDVLSDWYEAESKLELRIQNREEAEELKPMNRGYVKETIYHMECNIDVMRSYVDRINHYISEQEGLLEYMKSLV